jgi:hypothetical protein
LPFFALFRVFSQPLPIVLLWACLGNFGEFLLFYCCQIVVKTFTSKSTLYIATEAT